MVFAVFNSAFGKSGASALVLGVTSTTFAVIDKITTFAFVSK
jgi:hypothetical protein